MINESMTKFFATDFVNIYLFSMLYFTHPKMLSYPTLPIS